MKLLSLILPVFLLVIFSFGTYKTLSYFPQTTPSPSPAINQIVQDDNLTPKTPKLSYNQTFGTVLADTGNSTELAIYNTRLNQVYRSPLTITLKNGSSFDSLDLPPSFLRTLIIPPASDLSAPLQIDKDQLLNYLNNTLSKKQKEYFDPTSTYQNVLTAISLRFHANTTPVVLGVDDGPTSHGELAGRYLEVDLSQQKMYFFINQSLFKEYRISTGIDYPTPVGDYAIMNKSPLAFSDIYNVWMPYWMGFTYVNKLGASLGFHEIAYAAKDKKGRPIYNNGYYIGDKMTGGCVAMEPKDSKEIYDLTPVGMLVRIVP